MLRELAVFVFVADWTSIYQSMKKEVQLFCIRFPGGFLS